MLAVDTNIILRYLLDDHPLQSPKARALIEGNDVFISTTVLLETEWVLRSSYKFEPARIASALSDLAGLPQVTLQDAALAAKALEWTTKGVDFADALHLIASDNCDAFVTFDARFAKTAGRFAQIPIRVP